MIVPRNRRRATAVLTALAVVAGAIGASAWLAERQHRLDGELLAAIDRQDTPAALRSAGRVHETRLICR